MHPDKVSLPEIKNVSVGQIQVFFDQDFEEVLFVDGRPCKELQEYIERTFQTEMKDFREQVIISSVPFLFGVFYKDKEIRIYGPKLGQELFLCHHLASDCKEEKKLKDHTTKVARLSPQESWSVSQRLTAIKGLPKLEDLSKFDHVYKRSHKIMKELRSQIRTYGPSLFEQFSDYGLSLTAEYAILRIHLLKFLAILPSLDYDVRGNEVKRILLETFRRIIEDHNRAKNAKATGDQAPLNNFNKILVQLVHAIAYFLPAKILSTMVRFFVKKMAKRFIAGETIEKAKDGLKSLYTTNRDATLDQLGELVVSEKEADHYRDEVIKLVKGFSLHVKKGEKNAAGINRAHVSIKVSALCSDFKPYAFDYTYNMVAPRLKEILLIAKEYDVFINIDAEHYHYRDVVFKIYRKVLLDTDELKDFSATGIVVQAYLRDGYDHLKEVIELAQERKICMPIRLVKGAYWDAETIEAEAHGHNAPEFLNKEETDIHFRQLVFEILKNGEHIQLCLASHNFGDHSFSEALRELQFPKAPVIEHQCLHMTYEALSMALSKMNWPTRNYVPVGSLLVGMAYLVRRIMENSSQVGVLTIMRSHNDDKVLKRPDEVHAENIDHDALTFDSTIANLSEDFSNIAPARLYLDKELVPVQKAHEDFKKNDLGKIYENEFTHGKTMIDIHSSSDPEIIVGKIAFGEREDAGVVVDRSLSFYNSGDWSKLHWLNRSSILLRVAKKLLMRRNKLSALIVYEAGKTFEEALADVDEAIDFLNFYAREEGEFHRKQKEVYSRGVVVSITPWNFPLAIPCGMVAGPLVAGNTVILKSAEQTPLIAQTLVDIFHECGVPQDALIHIPGFGENVGDALVSDPRVSCYVFTGSKAVGTMIAEKAGTRIYENQVHDYKAPVKVITEMGGKNAIIVTANAELDETVAGILYSAYGHAGQKCSAASRILVDVQVKDRLIERLREASKDIKVGKAFEFSTAVNPVISHHDMERIQDTVIDATEEATKYNGQLHIDRTKDCPDGYCVGPAIIELPASRAFEVGSHCRKEIFGPVIHVIGFKNLDEAVKIYNSTDYALTGGIFSQSQDDIDYLSSKLQSGNIYINRSITGARVGIEPFGGFKLSGTGPKAGGKHYIPAFHTLPINLPANAELIENSIEDQKGSEYMLELCPKMKMSTRDVNLHVQKGIESIIANFENLFSGIYGENKQILKDYQGWLKIHLKDFLTTGLPNKEIPGQLSHNSYHQREEKMVIIGHEKRAHFSTMIQLISALSLGMGVTILARNKKSEKWWNRVVGLFRLAGIPKKSLDVFFPSKSILELICEDDSLKVIVIDGDMKKLEKHLPKILKNQRKQKVLKKIVTPFDSPLVTDFEANLLVFINVRSFAINTMRHGAPLNLEY